VVFTDTPEPAQIPPTNAPKAYYNQGEAVVIKPDVYMYMGENFSRFNAPCGNPNMEWGVAIYIKNESNSQFNLRFNTGGFSATDDLGTSYNFIGSGFPDLEQSNGLDKTYQMNPSSQTYICLSFTGSIPLEARYITVIADFISGVGPVTFRKDI